MKYSLLVILTLLSTQALAANVTSPKAVNGLIYHCFYDIYPPISSDAGSFDFSGVIIPTDALSNTNHTTYLTLAPNEISGVGLEARIWFWDDGTSPPFGEISFYKPGQSAEAVANTNFVYGQRGSLSYTDNEGSIYTLGCSAIQ